MKAYTTLASVVLATTMIGSPMTAIAQTTANNNSQQTTKVAESTSVSEQKSTHTLNDTGDLGSNSDYNASKLKETVNNQKGHDQGFWIHFKTGTKSVMAQFGDTLPDGMTYKGAKMYAGDDKTPNKSKEITTDGELNIDGQTITWTPSDPDKYFASDVYMFVNTNINKDTDLKELDNSGWMKDKDGKEYKGDAKVTLEDPKTLGKDDDPAKNINTGAFLKSHPWLSALIGLVTAGVAGTAIWGVKTGKKNQKA